MNVDPKLNQLEKTQYSFVETKVCINYTQINHKVIVIEVKMDLLYSELLIIYIQIEKCQ